MFGGTNSPVEVAMTDHKKSSTGFWATMIVIGVVLLPFLYLAALGPEEYLLAKGIISNETDDIVSRPYWLCKGYCGPEPEWFWKNYYKYLGWWYSLAH